MKQHLFLSLFILQILSAQSTPLDPATPSDWTKVGYAREDAIPRTFDYIINVKTAFGLHGDNSTDDAALFQQAINDKNWLYGNKFVVFSSQRVPMFLVALLPFQQTLANLLSLAKGPIARFLRQHIAAQFLK